MRGERTLYQRILFAISGLIAFTTVIILTNVWVSTTEHARNQMAHELNTAKNIAARVLQNRANQLRNSALVLTADFGFKQAVATQDAATITSALNNHGQRINADLMALFSSDGRLIAKNTQSQEEDFSAISSHIISAFSQRAASTTVVLNERIYQVIFLTVDAPRPIAVTMIGFELTTPFLEELKSITQLEHAFSLNQDEQQNIINSTLAGIAQNQLVQPSLINWFEVVLLRRAIFAFQSVSLSASDGGASLLMIQDVQSVYAGFWQLQLQITAIAVLCLILALSVALRIAKRITHPIRQLVKQSQLVANGKYDNAMPLNSGATEVTQLTNAFNQMQSNVQKRETEIRFQAERDRLTGLLNRSALDTHLNNRINEGKEFSVFAIKINRFRNINDVFGYQAGDQYLQHVAKRLATLTDCLVSRIGGGEYIVIPDTAKTLSTATLINLIKQPLILNQVEIVPSLSVAKISVPEQADNTEAVLRRLDITLDNCNANQLDYLHYRADFEDHYLYRLNVISELKQALANDTQQFSLLYQPKLSTRTGTCEAAEALLRWNNPKLGFIGPDIFIPLAEQSGLIHQLTFWVVQRVLVDQQTLIANDIHINIAINLSAQDLLNRDVVDRLINLVDKAQLGPQRISFELTESDLISDADLAIENMTMLRDAGFSLAIDDFGTGYSSLAYLRNMPVNTLKIDKSFVLKLDERLTDQKIVQTIIQLAHGFDLQVVAEGVETWQSQEALQDWGCEYIQGYYISRPIKCDDLALWLKQQKDQYDFSS